MIETSMMTMCIKNMLQKVLSDFKQQFPNVDTGKIERKIIMCSAHKELITSCLHSGCNHKRLLNTIFCKKHMSNGVSTFVDGIDFLIQNMSVLHSVGTYNKVSTPSFEEFSVFFNNKKKEYMICLFDSLLNDNVTISKDIMSYITNTFGESYIPIKKRKKNKIIDQSIEQLPFVESKCHARINSGRQCINIKYQNLNFCKIHKRSTPFGIYDAATLPTAYKRKEAPKLTEWNRDCVDVLYDCQYFENSMIM